VKNGHKTGLLSKNGPTPGLFLKTGQKRASSLNRARKCGIGLRIGSSGKKGRKTGSENGPEEKGVQDLELMGS
jgi:hypothetical protein